MTESELSKYWCKKIKVVGQDDKEIQGFCSIFTCAYDNDPEIPSITLDMPYGMVEITEPEIKSIEIIED